MEMIAALAVCLFISGYGWWMRSKQLETVRGWHKIKASIVEAGVKEEMRIPLDAPGKQLMYSPLVKYRYRVGNATYTGDTFRLYDDVAYWHSSKTLAISQGRKWRRGMKVMNYYNPHSPAESCLEEVTATPYLIMGFGLLWLILIPFFSKIMAS